MANHQNYHGITVSCYLFVVPNCYHALLQHRDSDIFPLVIVVTTHGSGSLNSSDPEWSTELG